MANDVYRFQFRPEVLIEDVEVSLLLAVLAVESLYGESQVRLDAAHAFDPDARVLVIDAATPVGRDLNRLLVGFLRREFGEAAFVVERVTTHPEPIPA